MEFDENGNPIEQPQQAEPVAPEPAPEPAQPEPQAEPTNIADAFKMLREQNAQPAEGSVQAGQEPQPAPDLGGTAAPEPASEPSVHAGDAAMGAGAANPVPQNTGIGGLATSEPPVDYGTFSKDLMDNLGRQALQDTQAKFRELNIQKINVTDLYSRDERTGSVTFRNPDDERSPFRSRMEAQQWCDSFNAQIDNEFRKMATQQRNELIKEYQPTMRLLQFAPKFNEMDEDVKEIFNQIIEPYQIKKGNNIMGYSCNLDTAAKQAERMVSTMKTRYKAAQPAQQAAAPQQQVTNVGSGPAVDMNTGKNNSGATQEPKSLEEAMRMLRKKGN